jgi:hypothetical protein
MYIIKNFNPLIEDEINKFVNNFIPTQVKGPIRQLYVNEYNKEFINPSDDIINVLKKLILEYFPNFELKYYYSRLNKVEEGTNPADGFHTDMGTGNIIILHYPKSNPHFEGGEFEWKDINGNSEIVKIENGMNVILVDNPPHRVLNVTKGERYSFAFFFDKYKKEALI